MAANGVLLCYDWLQHLRVLTFPHVLQPKRQLPLANQTEAHADQSRRTQDALDTMTASFDPLATQLVAKASHLAEAAQKASSMASSSAEHLAGSQELSNVSVFQDEAEGTSVHPGGNSAIDNQLQHKSRLNDDEQHV